MNKFFPITIAFFCSAQAFALVDYSEPVNTAPQEVTRPAPKQIQKPSRTSSSPSKSSTSRSGSNYGLEFKLGYESVAPQTESNKASAALYRGSMHIQTPYSLYFDASTFYGSSDDIQLSETSSEQKGNSEFLVGLNWLQFGSGAELGSVDLILGYRMGQRNSDFASSRSDYILGIESKKRIYDFALGLGYQYTIVGGPKDSEQISLGNIHHVYGELGYQATNDIIFSFAAGYYSIAAVGERESRYLSEKFTSSYFSPKLNLILAPYIGLELGAIFAGKRGNGAEGMVKDGLYHLKGVYGDSLMATLVVSL